VKLDALFTPFGLRGLRLANRIVMAPMTRSFSPGGVPGADVAAYYRRRAEGGVGLIVTEGTYIPHHAAGFDPKVPHMYGEDALAGWRRVVTEVHAAGGKIFSQLWHVGTQGDHAGAVGASAPASEIAAIVRAFGDAARNAKDCGFDGVEIHGAHGYLVDQFFWDRTNQRTDDYGGDLVARTHFAVDVASEIRGRVGAEFPVALRFSQWKIQDYAARLTSTPRELKAFLSPLASAGLDLFHCSTRRFWEPEFAESPLNLAGWTKKITGKPTITVGSVALNEDVMKSFSSDEAAAVAGIEDLLARLERAEFDLVAIGRSLIANPGWPLDIRSGGVAALRPFSRTLLAELV
jgi:2,4-dienoyl-CoA reductase-like NADH-dependent reductase (Old Yellow Enzyme family)